MPLVQNPWRSGSPQGVIIGRGDCAPVYVEKPIARPASKTVRMRVVVPIVREATFSLYAGRNSTHAGVGMLNTLSMGVSSPLPGLIRSTLTESER